jgi:multiple antibiotic resistance protein
LFLSQVDAKLKKVSLLKTSVPCLIHRITLKFLFAMFAILNPPGAIPVLLSLTLDQSADAKRSTARTTTVSVFIIMLIALFFGEALLDFFVISIHSFRVGGGILILMMALSMMHARTTDAKQTQEESLEAANRQSVAVVPLAMPILAGPGAISAVILFAHRSSSWEHFASITLVMIALSLTLYPFLRFFHRYSKTSWPNRYQHRDTGDGADPVGYCSGIYCQRTEGPVSQSGLMDSPRMIK